MSETFKAYVGDDIEVRYDKNRCLHVAECVKGLSEVFDVKKRPWIQPDNAEADVVAKIVERCPTGALEYTRKDGGSNEQVGEKTTVHIDGENRIYMSGNIEVQQGSETLQATRLVLCGCGYSRNKPFCDNSEECKP